MPNKHLSPSGRKLSVINIELARFNEEVPVVTTCERSAITLWWWDMAGRWESYALPHTELRAGRGPVSAPTQWNWSRRVGLAADADKLFLVYKRDLGRGESGLFVDVFGPVAGGPANTLTLTRLAHYKVPVGELGFSSTGFELRAFFWLGALHVLTQTLSDTGAVRLTALLGVPGADLSLPNNWMISDLGLGGYDLDAGVDDDTFYAVFRQSPDALNIAVPGAAWNTDLPETATDTEDRFTLDLTEENLENFYMPLRLVRGTPGGSVEVRALPGGEHPQLHNLDPFVLTFDRLSSLRLRFSRRASPVKPVVSWRPGTLVKHVCHEYHSTFLSGRLFTPMSNPLPRNLTWLSEAQELIEGEVGGGLRYASLFGTMPVCLDGLEKIEGEKGYSLVLNFLRHDPNVGALIRSRSEVSIVTFADGGPFPTRVLGARDLGLTVMDINHRAQAPNATTPATAAENNQFLPARFLRPEHDLGAFVVRYRRFFLGRERDLEFDQTIGAALVAEQGQTPLDFYAYTDPGDGGCRVITGGRTRVEPADGLVPLDLKRTLPPGAVDWPRSDETAWVTLQPETTDWQESELSDFDAIELLDLSAVGSADLPIPINTLGCALETRIDLVILKSIALGLDEAFKTKFAARNGAAFDPDDGLNRIELLAVQNELAERIPKSTPFNSNAPPHPQLSFTVDHGEVASDLDAEIRFEETAVEVPLMFEGGLTPGGMSEASSPLSAEPFVTFTIEPDPVLFFEYTGEPFEQARWLQDGWVRLRGSARSAAPDSKSDPVVSSPPPLPSPFLEPLPELVFEYSPRRFYAADTVRFRVTSPHPDVIPVAITFPPGASGASLRLRYEWSFTDEGNPSEIVWQYEAGGSDSREPAGYFTRPGRFSVTLLVSLELGGHWLGDFIARTTVEAQAPQTPTWSWSVTRADGSDTSVWRIGPGSLNDDDIYGRFRGSGEFLVRLTAELADGRSATAERIVSVLPQPRLSWAVEFVPEDGAEPPAGPTWAFAEGFGDSGRQTAGKFLSPGRHRIHHTAHLTDGTTRTATAEVNVRPSLPQTLWDLHGAFAAPGYKVGKASITFMKYEFAFDPAGGDADNLLITRLPKKARDLPRHDTQFRFRTRLPMGQGVVDYRARVTVKSSDITPEGLLAELIRPEVELSFFYGRSFTPGVLTSELRSIHPLLGNNVRQELAVGRPAALAAKPLDSHWLEVENVSVRVDLTGAGRTLLNMAAVLAFIGASLLILVLAGPIGIAALVLGVITVTVLIVSGSIGDLTAQFIASEIAPRVEEEIKKGFLAKSGDITEQLDEAGMLRYAGEGLAEALAVKAINQARTDGHDVPPPVEHPKSEGVGMNRFRENFWEMIFVSEGMCKILIRK